MFQVSLLAMVLSSSILVGQYRVAQAEPGHHQVSMRAAMAADGRFAIAWIDSLQLSDHFELDLFIRFFDKDGNPLSNAYKIPKLLDTVWINHPSLSMDSLGNTVLVWVEGRTLSNIILSKIRFQYFTPTAVPASSPKTLYSDVDIGYATPVSLANNGVFALAFRTRLGGKSGVWVQRFDLAGIPLDSAFLSQNSDDSLTFQFPEIALNDEDDVVVTWNENHFTAHNYPRFQAFDADDKPILPWEPKGHRVDDGDSLAGACRPDPRWIDNDRFVVFWTDYCYPPYLPIPLVGRIFSQKGAVKHPIHVLVLDSLFGNAQDSRGRFYAAVLPDGRFAETHTRAYYYKPDTSDPMVTITWEHAGGVLGQVVNEEPWRRTTLFEVSSPLGSDTLSTVWERGGARHWDTPPAVAACNDWLVWVYPRFNSDTIFEAWAVITDWNVGVGVDEKSPAPSSPSPVTHLPVTHLEIANPIGREIVVRFWDSPQGFRASVYDASGRKVDELSSPNQNGVLLWGEGQNPGVYFIVSEGSQANPVKVVLIR